MPLKSKEIAFFDFDGTLSKGDSSWRFILFCLGKFGFLKCGVKALFLTVVRHLTTHSKRPFTIDLKESCLVCALGGKSTSWLSEKASLFAVQVLPKLEKPEIHRILADHKRNNVSCILVSASPEVYLIPWATKHGFETVLATRLEVSGDIVKGSIKGENCKKLEKVNRIEAYLETQKIQIDQTLSRSHAYGNSSGDFEMLRAVANGWMVSGNKVTRFS